MNTKHVVNKILKRCKKCGRTLEYDKWRGYCFNCYSKRDVYDFEV